MHRREMLLLAAAFIAGPARAAAAKPMTIYRAAGCSCCEGWIAAMRRAGFAPKVVTVDDLSVEWLKRGVPNELSSCHMGVVDGYVVVGHVPPADVWRLLKQRPKAIGLTVPGMPDGSPGMERADGKVDAYNTLLLRRDARPIVFARHG